MNKTRPVVVAATIAGCLLVAACGGGSSAQSGGKVSIRFSYLWTGKEAEAMEKVIADFNKSQNKITVTGVSNPDQQAQLAAMTSTKGTYDISDSFGSNTGAWASKGVLEPLDEYVQADKYDLSDFVAQAMEQVKYDGKLYATPIAMHSFMLLYNKDLLEEAGIKEPPKTANELADATAKLTTKDSGGLTRLGFGSPTGQGTDYITLAMAWGGNWYSGGKPAPNTPQNVAAVDFYVNNVIKKYGAAEVQKFTSGFGEYQSPQNPFYQGKLAMMIDGEWQSALIQSAAPKLNWGAAPIPYPDDHPELAGGSQATASMLYIPRNSQHKKEAWEFMKYLLSPPAMGAFTEALTNLPARTSLLEDPRYDKLPNFTMWLDQLKSKNLKALPSLPSYTQYNADLTSAFDAVNRLEKSPADALAEVAGKVQGYE
ncbi:ABC transporter substrate-binding protein [Nonomuraea sp. NPDC005983]|uniref:ABC transporter substrate-binding protein n=1 Tax=Nonomuraea sp. NPDC005983 TaxID=3155595 RepID=UPI0033A9A59F